MIAVLDAYGIFARGVSPPISKINPTSVVAVAPITKTSDVSTSTIARLSLVVANGLVPEPLLVESVPHTGTPPEIFKTVPLPPAVNRVNVLSALA